MLFAITARQMYFDDIPEWQVILAVKLLLNETFKKSNLICESSRDEFEKKYLEPELRRLKGFLTGTVQQIRYRIEQCDIRVKRYFPLSMHTFLILSKI